MSSGSQYKTKFGHGVVEQADKMQRRFGLTRAIRKCEQLYEAAYHATSASFYFKTARILRQRRAAQC
jgi:hypothetical protein